jgi:RimJ/RimL family protein N-acetyltransferase
MTVPSKAIPAPASYAVTQRVIRSMLFGHELLRIGFEEAGLHRVAANADARNAASIRVMEKIGMRREAHFVQGSYEKGEWVDEVEYGILAAEWRAR